MNSIVAGYLIVAGLLLFLIPLLQDLHGRRAGRVTDIGDVESLVLLYAAAWPGVALLFALLAVARALSVLGRFGLLLVGRRS